MKKWKNNNNYTDCCPRRRFALKVVASDLTNEHEMKMDMEMAMEKGRGREKGRGERSDNSRTVAGCVF